MNKVYAVLALMFCTLASAADSTQLNSPLSFNDARHLLSRTGFGANPAEINILLGLNRLEAIEQIVAGFNNTPQLPPPDWTQQPSPHHWQQQELSADDRTRFRQTRLAEIQSLRQWWLQEMISTTSPQTERLMLFWHNHFATGLAGVNLHSMAMYRQHMMLRQHGTGSFRTLLKNIIRDPAMLIYLDNAVSRKQKPNENLARELMELFSLGEGHYTEQDIKNAARALTGYSFSATYDNRFIYKPWDHDHNTKTLFGKSGNFDGDDLVDLILEQPAAARFIATKLWRTLIGDIKINSAKITPHANAFRQSNYNITTLYKSLLSSDDFWHQNNRGSIVQSPVSLTVGTIRSTGVLPADWQTLPMHLTQMGQQLFEPPNVAGWPGGEAWIAPGRLLTRLEWLAQLNQQSGSNAAESQMMASPMMAEDTTANDPMMAEYQSNSTQTMSDATETLVVRLASEKFDEPVKYNVNLFGKEGKLWSSGAQDLPGGHDTKRMGRARQADLAWQSIRFPVHVNAAEVLAVEVSYLNDDSTKAGADRNLFIQSASLGNKTWLPEQGIQTSKCARNTPAKRGSLYCNGNVLMEQTVNTPQAPAPLPQNTVRVSGVYINNASNPNKKPHGQLVVTLADVEFEDRFWNTVVLRVIKNQQGYSLRLNVTDCWPDCFTRWPECAWTNKYVPEYLTVALPINNKQSSLNCMYEGLNATDKRFASALWMLVEKIYPAAANSNKIKRKRLASAYQSWAPHIDSIANDLQQSAYANNTIELSIEPRKIVNHTMNETINPPLPAGLTSQQIEAAWDSLRTKVPDLNLAKLLLPGTPLNPLVGESSTLSDITNDLTFQLK